MHQCKCAQERLRKRLLKRCRRLLLEYTLAKTRKPWLRVAA